MTQRSSIHTDTQPWRCYMVQMVIFLYIASLFRKNSDFHWSLFWRKYNFSSVFHKAYIIDVAQFILSQRPPIDVCPQQQRAVRDSRLHKCSSSKIRLQLICKACNNWFETDICSSGRFTDLFGRLLNIPSWHNSVQSAPRVVCFECRQATLTSRLSGDKFPTYLPFPQTIYL